MLPICGIVSRPGFFSTRILMVGCYVFYACNKGDEIIHSGAAPAGGEGRRLIDVVLRPASIYRQRRMGKRVSGKGVGVGEGSWIPPPPPKNRFWVVAVGAGNDVGAGDMLLVPAANGAPVSIWERTTFWRIRDNEPANRKNETSINAYLFMLH